MIWLLQKLSDWMNRPYDPTSSIERLREKYKKPIDSGRKRRRMMRGMGNPARLLLESN
jgi:hypothetical protein